MNIPEKIIEKAIEGGWNGGKHLVVIDNKFGIRLLAASGYAQWELKFEEISFDPFFWQSLGKAGANCMGVKCYLCAGHSEGLAEPFHDNGTGKGMPCPEHAGASLTYLILTNRNLDSFWQELLPENK